MDDQKLLVTEREACERLSVGRSTLRKLMAEGRIQGVHVGRCLRFHVSELARFAKEAMEQAALESTRV